MGESSFLNVEYEWLDIGRKMHMKICDVHTTLRDIAIELNIDVVKLSRMERGIIKPDLSLYEVLKNGDTTNGEV